jgi:uncharacterized protein (TIGR03083 family)
VEIPRHIEALRREGERLADVAGASDLDIPIPTTPEWRMRDLVQHMGDVHRWARTFVAEGRTSPIGRDELPGIAGPLPDDTGLLAWFREGYPALVRALESAPVDLECWTFMPAPSPRAFWARRQAHEIGIHRADAESPGGPGAITPFDLDIALDGIDELLLGFFGGSGEPSTGKAAPTLHVRAEDAGAGADWLVHLGERSERLDGENQKADCLVRGAASDLLLLLWNRRPADGLEVSGDRSILEAWRKDAQIKWGRPRPS